MPTVPRKAGSGKAKAAKFKESGPYVPIVSSGPEIRMEDVAQKAGVSRATVSRALRNHPAIPYSTRQRIKDTAERLGYHPNPFVAVLMSRLKALRNERMTSIIALISSFPLNTGWRGNPSVTRMVEGASAHAERLGYRIDPFCLVELGMTDNRLSEILTTRGIQGVIILPTPKSGAQLNLNWPKFSPVALGYSMASPRLHRVCNHLVHTVTTALDNVIRLGYRRIGMAMRLDTDDRVDHAWRSGYLLYSDMFPDIKFVPMLLTPKWSEQSFLRWFQKTKPELVVTDDMRVLEWLKVLGWRVPKDVGLVLLDRSKTHGACAGIDQHHEILGAAAVDLVVGQLHRNETGIPLHPKYVTIEGSWVNGQTVRQMPNASSNANGRLSVD
jgi:DNA-binding LacI/PurR family transcriptional regulator